jgi:hypothetical protein
MPRQALIGLVAGATHDEHEKMRLTGPTENARPTLSDRLPWLLEAGVADMRSEVPEARLCLSVGD